MHLSAVYTTTRYFYVMTTMQYLLLYGSQEPLRGFLDLTFGVHWDWACASIPVRHCQGPPFPGSAILGVPLTLTLTPMPGPGNGGRWEWRTLGVVSRYLCIWANAEDGFSHGQPKNCPPSTSNKYNAPSNSYKQSLQP